MLLHELLRNSAHKYPSKTAVVYQKERVTYSELDKRSDHCAHFLLESGIRKGDRVALFLDNSVCYVVAYFGILKVGGVVVPLNTQFVRRELESLLSDFTPKFVLTDSTHQASFKGLIDPKYVLTGETHGDCPRQSDYNANLRGLSPDLSERDLAMIIYTSGTTGKPKGVMLSHENLCANASSIVEYLHLKHTDSIMVILPFYYSYGNSLLTTHIKVGATLVIDNRFVFPNVVLDLMEKEQVTGFAGVPSHFAILLRKSALRKYHLASLRYVTQAGGGMAPTMIEEFIQVVPHAKFFVMYGQTEASARLTYLNPAFLKEKLGSIGKGIPGVQIRVLNEQGEEVESGQIGEIVARGRNVMLGYWNAPEETANVLKEEGLWTGDLAKVDEEGFIYMVSRKKEMIKSGANRISPLEIEDVVSRMPGVMECAAIAVPDEILGEAIKLCVVKNGVPFSENDLLLFCKKNLAAFKMPKVVEFIEALPKTSTGKIKRESLRGLSPQGTVPSTHI